MKLKVINNTKSDLSELTKHAQGLFGFSQKQLGFNKPTSLFFEHDPQNAGDIFGKTAFYNPNDMSITVYTTDRHPKDILRSFSHELVHHNQNCRGDFNNSTAMGESGYAQTDSHLRGMESEAYQKGNMIFRDWEDGLKYGTSYNTLKENKTMNNTEKRLREAIREGIKKILKEQVQPEAKLEENEADVLTPLQAMQKILDSGRTELLNMPLNKAMEELGASAEPPVQGLGDDYTAPDISWRGQGKASAAAAGISPEDEAEMAGPEVDPADAEADKDDLEEGLADDTSRRSADEEAWEREEEDRLKRSEKKKAEGDGSLEEGLRRRRLLRKQRREKLENKAANDKAAAAASEAAAEAARREEARKAREERRLAREAAVLAAEKASAEKEPLQEWHNNTLFGKLIKEYTKK